MVRGLFADDLSASSTPVDCPALVPLRTAHGLSARAVDRGAADTNWRVQICAALGERAGRQLCGTTERFCRSYGFSGLFCRAVAHNLVRSALFARIAVFLRLVTDG